MDIDEIRSLSDEEIQSRVLDHREELMNFRFQQATGELTDHNQVRFTRRTIARMLTVLRERELVPEVEEGEE